MNAASASIALACTAIALGNIFLLLTLLGAVSTQEQTTGTKLWATFGILTVIAGLNSYALDALGRHFGL